MAIACLGPSWLSSSIVLSSLLFAAMCPSTSAMATGLHACQPQDANGIRVVISIPARLLTGDLDLSLRRAVIRVLTATACPAVRPSKLLELNLSMSLISWNHECEQLWCAACPSRRCLLTFTPFLRRAASKKKQKVASLSGQPSLINFTRAIAEHA